MKALQVLSGILLALALTMLACPRSEAASGPEIDAAVDTTLRSVESQVAGARELAIKAPREFWFFLLW